MSNPILKADDALHADDWATMAVTYTDAGLDIGGCQVMQYWELPLMRKLAALAAVRDGDILEVGFGLGLSATEICRSPIRSYTVIEAHPLVAQKARDWARNQQVPVTVVEGMWQDVIADLTTTFDGICFDTYPLVESERGRNHFPFIPAAKQLLRSGGCLTYYSDETVDFRKEHLDLLLRNYQRVELHTVAALAPPPECDYWQHDHMVIPRAFA